LQQQAESSRTRTLIYRERDVVEVRLLGDYFGDNPKYPDYYFGRRYRMSRKLFLEIVKGMKLIFKLSILFPSILNSLWFDPYYQHNFFIKIQNAPTPRAFLL
jgi:hypothetical protein